ncbi:MAG TPA: PAS domain S-box protein [Leptospiraceae bacterium]|nr:PAS domain S-box protein [Leptospiraceae bacterium]HMW05862.1 PAS domain S-box protein [Leptospiraceae bacterium]HMX33200.1 PAS domain S-box protein [Leptospiraceae bacterium]HMY33648.1 PAS domain S-box protein [Leptospiraceae bacterium]HMZ64102.1 PAS domain S-box protein [Leptospiraceae bacterium]
MNTINKKTILLVEDELLIAFMEKQQLENEGYEVLHVSSGEQALSTINEKGQSIDLILMDIDLGVGLDGTQTATEILKEHDIPILFLSSRVEKEIVQKTEKISSYGYVVKNSGITVLDASIKMAFKLYEANKTTQRQKEQIGAILYSIGDAVISTDKHGNITSMNPIAEQLTGWLFSEANGKHLDDIFKIINAHSREPVQSPVNVVLSTGKIVGLANHTILVSKTGKEFQIADSGSPIRNQNGSIIGVVLVFRDVTKEYAMLTQIEESEKKYSILFNKSGIPTVLTKLPENQFVDVNESFENIFGYTKNEVVGKTSVEMGIVKKIDQVETEYHVNSPQKSYTGEREITTKSGESKFVTIHVSKVQLKNNDYAITTIYDITDRKKYEKLISNQANMLANVNDAIIATDSEFRITYWNASAVKIYGWKEEEALGQYAPSLLKTIYIGKERSDVVKSVLDKGKFFDVFIQSRKDGTQFYMEGNIVLLRDESLNVIGYISVNRDVTNRIKLEEKQKASEARLNGIVESAMDAIISLNQDSKVLLFNTAAEKMFGYKSEEVLNKNLDVLIPQRYKEKYPDSVEIFLRLGEVKRKKGQVIEMVGLRSNGEEFFIEVSISKINLGEEKIITAILRDITVRKNSEQKIINLLNEKEIILKEVHHRIKNNMLTILGLLTIQSSRLENQTIKNILLDAAGRVKSMMILYDKLYNTEDNGNISLKTYLPSFIQEIVNIFYVINPVQIETKIDDIILTPTILSPLGIIFNEWITNTIKYNSTKGQISIRVSAERLDNHIRITYEDNGSGLPEGISYENSTGFGLQLIHMLAHQINGSVFIDQKNRSKNILEIPLSK